MTPTTTPAAEVSLDKLQVVGYRVSLPGMSHVGPWLDEHNPNGPDCTEVIHEPLVLQSAATARESALIAERDRANQLADGYAELVKTNQTLVETANYLKDQAIAERDQLRAALPQWLPIEQASKNDKDQCWLLVDGAVHRGAWMVISYSEQRDMEGRYIDHTDADQYWMDVDDGEALDPSHFCALVAPPLPPALAAPAVEVE